MSKVLNTWTFGGVRLSSFGAVTELDSYLDLPVKRGDNASIPMIDGAIHVTKMFDQRLVSFGIEVDADDICDLETKFDTMKRLLGSRGQQYLQYQSPTGLRRAYAELVGQLGVTRDPDPLVAKVVIDFLLSEPYFRSDVLYSKEVTVNGETAMDILNAGTVDERAATIIWTGPLQHPKIEHIATGIWVQYDEDVAGGETVTYDCRLDTAISSVSGNVRNNMVHYGDPCFLPIPPDTSVDAHHFHATNITETTGKAKVQFYTPYL